MGPSLSTVEDLSAIVYSDGGAGGSNTVSIVLSDGRGIDWSVPVRVDQDLTSGQAKFTQRGRIGITR